MVRKAQHRRALFEERKHAYELANKLLKSRENLLLNAYKQGFSQTSHRSVSKFHWKKPKPALGKFIVTSLSFFYMFRAVNFVKSMFSRRESTNAVH